MKRQLKDSNGDVFMWVKLRHHIEGMVHFIHDTHLIHGILFIVKLFCHEFGCY